MLVQTVRNLWFGAELVQKNQVAAGLVIDLQDLASARQDRDFLRNATLVQSANTLGDSVLCVLEETPQAPRLILPINDNVSSHSESVWETLFLDQLVDALSVEDSVCVHTDKAINLTELCVPDEEGGKPVEELRLDDGAWRFSALVEVVQE